MLLNVFIPYLLYVFATIAIALATELTDTYSLTSAATLIQGLMVNCLCL